MKSSALEIGSILKDRYKLVKHIAGKTFGEVYQANDKLNYDELVAIRVFSNSALTPYGVEAEVNYIIDNGIKLLQLNHSNIAHITDFELSDKEKFVVSECFLKYSLQDLIDDIGTGKVSIDDDIKKSILKGILDAVTYLKRKGLDNNKLDFSSILIEKRGSKYTPKLTGFIFPAFQAGEVILPANKTIYNDEALFLDSLVDMLKFGDKDLISKLKEHISNNAGVNYNDLIRLLKKEDSSVNADALFNCPECQSPVDNTEVLCHNCGTKLFLGCPECLTEYSIFEENCTKCRTDFYDFTTHQGVCIGVKYLFDKKDPYTIRKLKNLLPEEEVSFVGSKGKLLNATIKKIVDKSENNLKKAEQLRETIEIFIDNQDYPSALEVIEAYQEFVSTNIEINDLAKEAQSKLEDIAFEKASKTSNEYRAKKDYLTAIAVYQEFVRQFPVGKNAKKANKIIKNDLLEKQHAHEILIYYSELLNLIDEKKFQEAILKSERILKLVDKINDLDAPLENKKVTASDIHAKTLRLQSDIKILESQEKKKQIWIMLMGIASFIFIIVSILLAVFYLRIEAKQDYAMFMKKADLALADEEYQSALYNYRAALKIRGFQNDRKANYGCSLAKTLRTFSRSQKKIKHYTQLMKNYIETNDEYLVSRYYYLAATEIEQVLGIKEKKLIPANELNQIVSLKNYLYEIRVKYWQKTLTKKEFVVDDLGIVLKQIPKGTAVLGVVSEKDKAKLKENKRTFSLDKKVWVGKFEITQKEYKKLMGKQPASFKSYKLTKPVEMVTWNDAQRFCDKLNDTEKKLGRLDEKHIYRLPTVDEWEYICRAGTETTYNCGDDITIKDANFSPNDYIEGDMEEFSTKNVGLYKPNAWGIYDMHGNVAEWCLPADNNSKLAPIKGGGWFDSKDEVYSAFQNNLDKLNRSDNIGFRVIFTEK